MIYVIYFNPRSIDVVESGVYVRFYHMGHFIIRGTFGVRQVTYAIKMKYFTIKTNSFFLSRMNSI